MPKLKRYIPSDYGPVVLPIIATTALAVSSGTLYALMVRLHWPEWQAALLPVSVDVLAGYAVSLWLTAKDQATITMARAVALACLIVSVAGNALEHGLDATEVRLWVWVSAALAVIWGSVPPVAFFIGTHLYATSNGRRAKAPVSTPGDKPVDKPARAEPIHVVASPSTSRTDGQILAELAALPALPTKREAMARYTIGSARALKLLDQARKAA